MRNTHIRFNRGILLLFAAAMVIGFTSSSAYASREEKVAICHLPPGNPENIQHIEVGESAVVAHLAHGDFLGDSLDDCLEDETPSSEEETSSLPAPSTARVGVYSLRSIQGR